MNELEKLLARKAEIRSLNIDELSDEEVRKLNEEVDQLEAKIKELRASADQKKELRNKIATGEKETRAISRIENTDNSENVITRNSVEYQRAFIKAIKTGNYEECRTLLSVNATNGTIAVPEVLENEIKNAWEQHDLISKCDVTNQIGDVKVSFEYASSDAAAHTEGGQAANEGTISIGIVTISAVNIMKWITVSVEAIENTTINTLAEIYKSLANKIVEGVEAKIVSTIDACPTDASTATSCLVKAQTVTTISESTISDIVSFLSGQAKNVTLLMNRRTRAAFMAVKKAAKYNVDVFDGLDDKIVFTDELDAFQDIVAAGEGGTPKTYLIAGDFGFMRVNKPHGDDMKVVLDEITMANQGIDKVIGRQFVGCGVVAPKAFAKLNK